MHFILITFEVGVFVISSKEEKKALVSLATFRSHLQVMYFLEIFHIWWLSYISVKFHYRKQYFLAFFPNPLVIPYLVPVEPLFWDVKEICVHTLFSVRNVSHPWLTALLKVLCLICQQILSFFFFQNVSWFIPSLNQASNSHTMKANNHIGSPSHQVTLTSTSECWDGLWKWPLYLPGLCLVLTLGFTPTSMTL